MKSPVAAADDAPGSHAANQRLLDDVEKQLYQRIVAKLKYFARGLLDLRYATSCLASAAAAPDLGDLEAATCVGWYVKKSACGMATSVVPGPEYSSSSQMLAAAQCRIFALGE